MLVEDAIAGSSRVSSTLGVWVGQDEFRWMPDTRFMGRGGPLQHADRAEREGVLCGHFLEGGS